MSTPITPDTGGDRRMFDACGRTVEFGLVLRIAEAWREEVVADIDPHPGGPGNEAVQASRAYRAAARRNFRPIAPPKEDLPSVVARDLRQAARRRLAGDRLPGPTIEALLDARPGLGDSWPAYLALAPPSVIRDLLEPEPPGPG